MNEIILLRKGLKKNSYGILEFSITSEGTPPLKIWNTFFYSFTTLFTTLLPSTGAFKSATKNTTFERRAKQALKSAPLSLSRYPLPVHSKVPKKPPLLRGEQSEPCKVLSSFSSKAREVPFLHTPYR